VYESPLDNFQSLHADEWQLLTWTGDAAIRLLGFVISPGPVFLAAPEPIDGVFVGTEIPCDRLLLRYQRRTEAAESLSLRQNQPLARTA
jgi:hypothetical protein